MKRNKIQKKYRYENGDDRGGPFGKGGRGGEREEMEIPVVRQGPFLRGLEKCVGQGLLRRFLSDAGGDVSF